MPPQRDEEINNRNGEKAKIETVIQVKPGGRRGWGKGIRIAQIHGISPFAQISTYEKRICALLCY